MKKILITVLFLVLFVLFSGCGEKGKDGSSCTVIDNEDGTATIQCDDGSEVTIGDSSGDQPGDENGEDPDDEETDEDENGEDPDDDGEDEKPSKTITRVEKIEEDDEGHDCENGGYWIIICKDDGDGECVEDSEEKIALCHGQDGKDGDSATDKIFFGDYHINNLSDLSNLDNYEAVSGDIHLTNTDIVKVNVPGLRIIGGGLFVKDNENLENFELESLESIGMIEISNNAVLKKLKFPLLTRTASYINVERCDFLTTIDFSFLSLVQDGLRFHFLPSLNSLNLESLMQVGTGLSIHSTGLESFELLLLETIGFSGEKSALNFLSPGLSLVSTTLLKSVKLNNLKYIVGGVSINSPIETLEWDSLEKIEGALTSGFRLGNSLLTEFAFPASFKSFKGGITFYRNDLIAEIDLSPVMSVSQLTIGWCHDPPEQCSGNASLESLYINNIATVEHHLDISGNISLKNIYAEEMAFVGSSFTISYNNELDNLSALALKDQIMDRDGIGGAVTISNNKP